MECLHGYYLKNNKECVAVINKPNCELYSTNDDETTCLKCWNTHFLTSNQCSERQNLSDLCKTYSIT